MKFWFILSLIAIVLFAKMASATDIAYIITSNTEPAIIETINELNLSYEVIFHTAINSSYNFSRFKMILLTDDYFVNWNRIPINEIPAIVVGASNIKNWGWTTGVTLCSETKGIYVNINTSHEIATGLPSNFKVYNANWPDAYLLDKMDIFQGFEIVASNPKDNQDAVVALARAGTTLTHTGYPDTEINANSIFFGIYDSEHWSEDSKQLFKNSLLWLYEEIALVKMDIDLKEGQNLISFPLTLTSNDINGILAQNPEIISIQEYDTNTEGIIESIHLDNNKGYFLESSTNFTLTIRGEIPTQEQNVPLVNGMNLIGLTSSSNMDLDDLDEEITEVARRNLDGTYDIATRYESGWHNEFPLEPGRGYWFNLSSQIIWSYNP